MMIEVLGGSVGGFYKRFRQPVAPLPAELYGQKIYAVALKRRDCIVFAF
jgi:hypothetical protein